MSTNYYFKPDSTTEYASITSLHIGKMTSDSFGFHGVRIKEKNHIVNVGSVEFEVTVPTLVLTTANEWRKFLSETKGVITTEYNEIISVENFIERIKGQTNSPYKHLYYDENSWVDKEGYTFSDNVFH